MAYMAAEVVAPFHVECSTFDFFSSWQNTRAGFILLRPTYTEWYVELIPLTRIFRSRNFLIRLGDESYFVSDVTVKSLEMSVSLNGIEVRQATFSNYPFSEETGYVLNFEVEINDYNDSSINNLDIMILFDIEKGGIDATQALTEGLEIPLLFGGFNEDMEFLRHALGEIKGSRQYSTLTMYSRDDLEIYVHHFILQVRWNNLFRFHDLTESSDSVHTDISYSVLQIIIDYMYDGAVNTTMQMWNESSYVAELFQVLSRYKIFHMYGALLQSHERITLRNLNYSDKQRLNIKLNYVKNKPLIPHSFSYSIYVCPYADYLSANVFLFTVHMKQEKLAGPWLSYSVLSRTAIPFNVHVNLEMQGIGEHTKCIYSSDYDIPGNERIVSGPILFLGCPETFCSHFQDKISKKLFFNLTFHHRTSSISVWSLYVPEEAGRLPLDVLSRHMSTIYNRKFKADLLVKTSRCNGYAQKHYPIHKAMFAARVTRWWDVVEPRLSSDAPLPDSVNLSIGPESFDFVEFYMYVGKTHDVPLALQEEIMSFSDRSGFFSLYNAMMQLRMQN